MRKGLGYAVGVTVVLVAAASPYLLTRWSGASLCVTELRLVTPAQKIAAVLDYLEAGGHLTAVEKSRIDPATCCRVDNGGRDLVPLGLSNYLLGGLTHYVHIPAELIPRYNLVTTNGGIREGIFALTNCGVLRT